MENFQSIKCLNQNIWLQVAIQYQHFLGAIKINLSTLTKGHCVNQVNIKYLHL